MFSKTVFITLISLFTCCIFFSAISGQPPKVRAADEQKTPQEDTLVTNLIFDARSHAPEIAADALITIAESGKVKGLQLRHQILEEAFALADRAQHPVRIRYTGSAHTPISFLYLGFELKLDRLALRSRVIKAFLKFDKAKARKLFLNEMEPDIELPPLGCENAVRYYDVTDYYETAAAVFSETFSPKERSDPAFAYSILPFIERMSSPAQANPVVKMLVGMNLKPAQLSLLATSYGQALAKIRNDDFTFRISASEYSGIKDLSNTLGENTPGGQPGVINAYRDYVIKQLNGPRCSDGIKKDLSDPLNPKYQLPVFVQRLNNGLFKEKPIGADEIAPESIVKATKSPYYWDSPKSSARWNGCLSLISKEGGQTVYSEEDKRKPEWQAALDRYLLELRMWEDDEENNREDFVTKKSIIFARLLQEAVPTGPAWDAVMKEYVLFLSRNELRNETRIQWLTLVRGAMVDILLKNLKGDERVKMISLVKSFKNPTIDLYCDLMLLKGVEKTDR